MQCYLVGGAVRDTLLGYPVHERDWVVVGATVEEMLQQGYRPVGKTFPVFLHPTTHEEYALARTERKTGQGYHGFTCISDPSVSLEADLKRRDLTLNAIAMDDNGQYIDPYHGIADLHNKCLRHVSDAFVEDPVRILRVARFMARYHHLGFTVAEETRQLMYGMVKTGELNHLIAERVWKEWQQSLTEKNPAQFLLTLRACDALRILLPELHVLFGVPSRYKTGIEDTGVHLIKQLEAVAAQTTDPIARFAVTLSEIEKIHVPATQWPIVPADPHNLTTLDNLCNRLRIPHAYRQFARLLIRHQVSLSRGLQLSANACLLCLEHCQAFRQPALFHTLLQVCQWLHPDQTTLIEHWNTLATRCRTIETAPFIAQGLTGKALGHAIEQHRLHLIEQEIAYEKQ